MAYTTNYLLTTVEGGFGSGKPYSEQWRCTWKMPVPGVTNPSESLIQDYLTAIVTPITAFHQESSIAASSNTFFEAVSAALIGTDGKYLGGGQQVTQRKTLPTHVPGTGATGAPWSQSLCVSMGTGIARGRGSRGRFYWPSSGLLVSGSEGRLSTTQQNTAIASARSLLDAVNSQAATVFGGLVGKISVMSNLGAGTTATVLTVSVGRRLDAQERREKNLNEGHVWTDLVSTREEAELAVEARHAALAAGSV